MICISVWGWTNAARSMDAKVTFIFQRTLPVKTTVSSPSRTCWEEMWFTVAQMFWSCWSLVPYTSDHPLCSWQVVRKVAVTRQSAFVQGLFVFETAEEAHVLKYTCQPSLCLILNSSQTVTELRHFIIQTSPSFKHGNNKGYRYAGVKSSQFSMGRS